MSTATSPRRLYCPASLKTGVSEDRLRGNVALVSHGGRTYPAGRFWFRDFRVEGSKFEQHDDRAFGPLLGTSFSVSDGVLKLTAQFPPLGFGDEPTVRLFTRPQGTAFWQSAGRERIVTPGYTAHFRVEGWDDTRAYEYDVRYDLDGQTFTYDGTIPANPKDESEIVVAAFTGKQNMGRPADDGWGAGKAGSAEGRWTRENVWLPQTRIVENIPKHGADLLFFSGDQIYEEGHVFMIGGDTHLAAVVEHGVEEWRDAGVHFVVPSVSNKYRRWWDPNVEGQNRAEGAPGYTGDHVDGFLNKVTVYAAGNPKLSAEEVRTRNIAAGGGADPHALLDRTLTQDGYGIIRLDKPAQTITMEAWRYDADPDAAHQLPDWPVTTSEIVYTTRALNGRFTPVVFSDGPFTLRVFEPGTEDEQTLTGLEPEPDVPSESLRVSF